MVAYVPREGGYITREYGQCVGSVQGVLVEKTVREEVDVETFPWTLYCQCRVSKSTPPIGTI
jgi:hypothetical protein